ncbi:hypothetical protein GYMLUDRAFT_204172 [Collybiopsis luxurians FD-317 M1]|uniref:Glycosyltransferase 2-like domain-containing protein n=1 Tax=Collybiopsis luxurians FD-317 M1 TaxID=944289 RepID=A0A0D0CGH4_9AGAR|nr:hypothetical protein GYMLUDRAFT_204172 [Collybiopsis luxurians FD-317 M1]
MDYDRWDALLHHLFKQTQGDAWFKPDNEVSSGVAVRVNDIPEFRVFPYENIALEPFEAAVTLLNPVVAVKVRNAAAHAALAEISQDDSCIFVDTDTRIQVLETMSMLPQADKEQCAAFIRDERVLVIWSDSLHNIIPVYQDLEERLIKLLWRPAPGSGTPTPIASSTTETEIPTAFHPLSRDDLKAELAKQQGDIDEDVGGGSNSTPSPRESQNDAEALEDQAEEKRPVQILASVYTGVSAGLALVFMGASIARVLQEWILDGGSARLALFITLPFLYCVSLFFTLQIIQNIAMAIGPIAHFHTNSKYFSAVKPHPNRAVDSNLPHITIQMPVYKENLESVLTPSIQSIKRAMQTYARQGGSSALFINDDGLRSLPPSERNERIAYYAEQNIGWVARPVHSDASDGFKRAGRFKKASNMNYALALSQKLERHLLKLMAEQNVESRRESTGNSSLNKNRFSSFGRYGLHYQSFDESGGPSEIKELNNVEDLEEKALNLAIEEVYEATDRKFLPWAANGKACRIGEIILLVDSDTKVPSDCLRDAAREMKSSPTVAIIQHESDILKVAHHYFENGMAYLTHRATRTISVACANGEVPPFMGHNAFLRWSAIQDAAFVNSADGVKKFWSESNVSEDFDMALRLLRQGYILRWATYSNGEFKEGVSLTVEDEKNRWQKYAYGCSEILFNPVQQWLRRGPITPLIFQFMQSRAPLHYKLSTLAYISSYYGIAASLTIAVINYILLGFQFPVDGFYTHDFEIWLACIVVFFGSGSVGYSLFEYRVGSRSLAASFYRNLIWIPMFFVFFTGLAIPLSQAILAHMFSYNISWSATVKEVRRSNFFTEIPQIFNRFWFPLLVSFTILVGVVLCSTSLVPIGFRVAGSSWGVILPVVMDAGCHLLFPVVLNPWLMVFLY